MRKLLRMIMLGLGPCRQRSQYKKYNFSIPRKDAKAFRLTVNIPLELKVVRTQLMWFDEVNFCVLHMIVEDIIACKDPSISWIDFCHP